MGWIERQSGRRHCRCSEAMSVEGATMKGHLYCLVYEKDRGWGGDDICSEPITDLPEVMACNPGLLIDWLRRMAPGIMLDPSSRCTTVS